MFTEELSPQVFATQRKFIRVMDAKRDFVWWAETLVTEEVKELRKADVENEGMEQIFKEFADVVYVMAGFYNTMPHVPNEIVSDETNENLNKIVSEAVILCSEISQKYKIPPFLIEAAFYEVHRSNMSKLGEDGKPIRREDGKVMKGPNYSEANMKPIVTMHEEFLKKVASQEAADNTKH